MFIKKGWTAAKAMAAMAAFKTVSPLSSAAAEGSPGQPTDEDLGLRKIAARRLHHGDGRFVNPFNDTVYGRMGRVLAWKLFSRNPFRKHYDQEPHRRVSVNFDHILADGGVSVTLLRHATLILKDGPDILWIDPVFGGLFGFIEDFAPLDFDPAAIPSPDQILVTHGHYDHLDKPSLALADRTVPVITPLGYGDTLSDLNLTRHRELDWYETVTAGRRRITLLPCSHWSMRNPFTGPNRSLWGSFLIETAGGPTLYIAGDTGYFDGFTDIGREFDIDLAVFNLGAYEPRWFMKSSHMDPQETVRAVKALDARRFFIAHWGTFRLGDEPVHFPPRDIDRAARSRNLSHRYVPLDLGQTYFFDGERIG